MAEPDNIVMTCCGRKASDHGNDGCLNGWEWDAEGIAATAGCRCPVRGMTGVEVDRG
jgi:hypothetical protein